MGVVTAVATAAARAGALPVAAAAKAAVRSVVARVAAGRVAGRVAAAAVKAGMATVRFREEMAAGTGIVMVRRCIGLQERRAGTYSLEDDGGAAALPVERVQTSLRTE
jgi:hypothetical protein